MNSRLDSNNAPRRDSSYSKPAQDVDEPTITENDDDADRNQEVIAGEENGKASSTTFNIPLDDDSDQEEKFQTEEKNHTV